MTKEPPYSPKYSPVNMRNEHIDSAADAKNKNVVDDVGYVNKIKLFSNNPVPLAKRPSKSKTTSKICHHSWTILFVIGFFLSLFLTIFAWFTDMYTGELFKRLTIQNGSLLYESWRDPPVKPLICVYLFNYTNVIEFMRDEDKKLKVKEIGPYCYRETLYRVNVTDHKNGSQTFNEMKIQEFDYATSNGNDSDIIIVPDIPYMSAIAMTKDEFIFIRSGMSTILSTVSDSPFVTVTVRDFCFGYQDSVIDALRAMAKLANKPVPFEKFGLFIKRTGVNPDRLTVLNGDTDLLHMGQVIQLNGNKMLHPWSTDECNSVGGSDGMLFPRSDVQQTLPVMFFHKDSCRKLKLVFDSKEKMSNGVIGHRYILDHDVFNNSVSENMCYCTDQPCMPDGIFDMGPCSTKSPVVMSRAHFLYGDPSLLDTVEGLNPDPAKHELVWNIDPVIGITMKIKMRIQLNIQVRNPNGYGLLSKIPDNSILPITWLDFRTETSPELSSLLFHLTFSLQWLQMFLMCISLVGLLGTTYCLMRACIK